MKKSRLMLLQGENAAGRQASMVTLEDIRIYARDIPELNILLEGRLQSPEELVELAMRLAAEDFNATPPLSAYRVEDFPSDTVMLYGVLHHLANAEAERQLRNQVTYNAQGLNAGIDDKYPQYAQLAAYYKQLFEQKIREHKVYSNYASCWGGVDSPYSALNEYDFRE